MERVGATSSVAGSVGVDRGYRGVEGEGEGEVRGWRARL